MTKNRLENIFLMRHANSMANADRTVYLDLPDHAIPLAPHGHAQAVEGGEVFARFLKSNPEILTGQMRLWFSPYLRTRQTMHGLIEGMGDLADCFERKRENILLAEQNFGVFSGLTDVEKMEQYPNEYKQFQLCVQHKGKFYARPAGGESRFDTCARVQQTFGSFTRDAERDNNPIKNIFIIAHGTVLRAFVMMWLHHPVDWFEDEPNPDNASIRHIGRDATGQFVDHGLIFNGYPDQDKLRKLANGEK